MRYAYVHKNLRQLSFEEKVILGGHVLTLIACFCPWLAFELAYAGDYWFSAFRGSSFLIGYLIFFISFGIVALFLDRLFEKEAIRLPFSANYVYGVLGLQQVLLIILAWSVLFIATKEDSTAQIRFGIFLAFMAQIATLVATFLNYQLEKQHQAKAFFQHPAPAKNSDEASDE